MAGSSLKGVDAREAVEQIMHSEQVVPKRVQCDNGSEFISKIVNQRCTTNGSFWTCADPENRPITPMWSL